MADSRPGGHAVLAAGLGLMLVLVPGAYGQEGGAKDDPVTREEFARFLQEYRQFQGEVAELREENERLKKQLSAIQAAASAPSKVNWDAEVGNRVARERGAIMQQVRDEFGATLDSLAPGLTNLTLGGFATVNYQDRRNTDSTFSAMMAPILLWKPTDKLLFEAELHIMLGEDETHLDLGYAHLSYLLSDYMTVGVGKFLLPFGTFNERSHPSWINKLPTNPLMTNLVGEAGLGVQVRGGFPVGRTKLNYVMYYINGPEFLDSGASAGRLDFGRNTDNNNSRAVGGRVGFLPIPEFEVGFSILSGQVGDSGDVYSDVDTVMHGVDFAYAKEFDAIRGRLDLRGEFVWVDTDDAVFAGSSGAFSFDNRGNGWYVQAAYRPTKVDLKLGGAIELRNFEFVVRYDELQRPGPAGLGGDRDRVTVGLDYWMKPNWVLKAAYMFDDARGRAERDGFYLQMGVGF